MRLGTTNEYIELDKDTESKRGGGGGEHGIMCVGGGWGGGGRPKEKRLSVNQFSKKGRRRIKSQIFNGQQFSSSVNGSEIKMELL